MASNNGIACVEYTDTFSGEANYSWVRSYSFQVGDKSPLGIVRTAKKLIGINGMKCKVHDYGEMIEVRPQGSNTVAFITFQDATPKAV